MSYREEIAVIYKNEGLFGFTRGYTGLFMRDCPGFALYFWLFEYLKRVFNVSEENKNKSKFDVALRKFLCGGISGLVTWTSCYPMDTIKTTMQTYEGIEKLKWRYTAMNLI